MINSFADKDLEICWRLSQCVGIDEAIRKPVLLNLALLDAATNLQDLARIPGCQLQPLPGTQKGIHSLAVQGSWHIIFRYENGVFCDLRLTKYQYETFIAETDLVSGDQRERTLLTSR